MLARHIALGYGPFFHRVHGLAGLAFQKKHHAGFGNCHHHGNLLSVTDDLHKRRRGFGIVIPHVMVGQLEMPAHLTGDSIQSHNGRRKQVISDPASAIVLRRGLANGQEHKAARLIHRSRTPMSGRPGVDPVILLPGFVAGLTGARNGVESPRQFARAQIPRANVHGRAIRIVLLALGASDNEVAEDGPRRAHMIRRVGEITGYSGFQIHHAFIAEPRHQQPRLRIQCKEFTIHRARKNLRRMILVSHPVSDAAQGCADASQRVFPDLLAGLRLQRDNGALRGGSEKYSAHHHRNGLHAQPRPCFAAVGVGGRRGHTVLPGKFELADGFGVDLRQRGVALTACVSVVCTPFILRGQRKCGQPDKKRDSAVCSLHAASTGPSYSNLRKFIMHSDSAPISVLLQPLG